MYRYSSRSNEQVLAESDGNRASCMGYSPIAYSRTTGNLQSKSVWYSVIFTGFPVSTDLPIIKKKKKKKKKALVQKEPTTSTCLRGDNTLLNYKIHKVTDLWEQFTSKLVFNTLDEYILSGFTAAKNVRYLGLSPT